MQRYTRLLTALAILLSGLTLLPFINLPTEAFGWQRYAGAYQPILTINYTTGQPGSYFTLTGNGFTANSSAAVLVNGNLLGTVPTDASGNVTFILYTPQADVGYYAVLVLTDVGASQGFTLSASAPLRPQEGSGPILEVPAGMAANNFIYLPIIRH